MCRFSYALVLAALSATPLVAQYTVTGKTLTPVGAFLVDGTTTRFAVVPKDKTFVPTPKPALPLRVRAATRGYNSSSTVVDFPRARSAIVTASASGDPGLQPGLIVANTTRSSSGKPESVRFRMHFSSSQPVVGTLVIQAWGSHTGNSPSVQASAHANVQIGSTRVDWQGGTRVRKDIPIVLTPIGFDADIEVQVSARSTAGMVVAQGRASVEFFPGACSAVEYAPTLPVVTGLPADIPVARVAELTFLERSGFAMIPIVGTRRVEVVFQSFNAPIVLLVDPIVVLPPVLGGPAPTTVRFPLPPGPGTYLFQSLTLFTAFPGMIVSTSNGVELRCRR